MTPFLQVLKQQQERQQEERRVMLAFLRARHEQAPAAQTRPAGPRQLVSLMALTIAQLNQQTHAQAPILYSRLWQFCCSPLSNC